MKLQYAGHGLTMKGHNFLDAIQGPSISTVGSWSLDTVSAVAKEEIKRALAVL